MYKKRFLCGIKRCRSAPTPKPNSALPMINAIDDLTRPDCRLLNLEITDFRCNGWGSTAGRAASWRSGYWNQAHTEWSWVQDPLRPNWGFIVKKWDAGRCVLGVWDCSSRIILEQNLLRGPHGLPSQEICVFCFARFERINAFNDRPTNGRSCEVQSR